MTIVVAGGAGFIGTNFVLNRIEKYDEKIIVLDKLTYAGNLKNFSSLTNNKNLIFIEGDISNKTLIKEILQTHHPRGLINFAAETHVDNSIKAPEKFVHTNILGTFKLLEETKKYYEKISLRKQSEFRFLNINR